MDLVEIGRAAWRMTWRHKALWVFGLFVASGGGGGGAQVGPSGGGELGLLWLLVAFAGVLGLAAFVMHVVSEGALIDAARRVRAGEAPRAGEEARAGRAAFWRVLRVKLAGVAALLLLSAVLAIPALLAIAELVPWLAAVVVGLPLAVAVVPLLLVAYVVYVYALRFAVLDGVGAVEAARRGWAFLHGRVLETLQLVVLAFLGQVGGAVAAIAGALPGVVLGLVLWLATGSIWIAAVPGGLVALPAVLLAAGAAGTFRSSVWTMGFLESREAARV